MFARHAQLLLYVPLYYRNIFDKRVISRAKISPMRAGGKIGANYLLHGKN